MVKDKSKKNWFKRHPIWTIIIGVFLLFALIGAFLPDNDSYESNSGETLKLNEFGENYEINTFDACVYTQLFVKENLKSPSTAKFPACSTWRINYQGNKTYFVHSYVDSQNSFGAMLRTDFSAEVTDLGFTWELKDMEFYNN